MSPSRKLQVTIAIRRTLKSELRRTRVTELKLFKDDAGPPEGLTAGMVNRWMSGLLKQAEAAHLDYVWSRYAALPDKASGRSAHWLKYTAEMAEQLQGELKRTGKTPKSLLHNLRNIPGGLTTRTIEKWVHRKAGFVSTPHRKFVLDQLATVPDKTRSSGSRYLSPARHPTITKDALEQLRRYREMTGIGGDILLKLSAKKPEGLTSNMISGWLNGTTKSVNPAYIEYVLNAYRNLLGRL
jgi:hypothetical protein